MNKKAKALLSIVASILLLVIVALEFVVGISDTFDKIELYREA